MALDFDYIIAGGGAAGLSLLWHLHTRGLLSDRRVLLIDPVRRTDNDRTWCFWEKEAGPFEDIVHHRWNHFTVAAAAGPPQQLEIAPYTYKMIRSAAFYDKVYRMMEQYPGVQFLQEGVSLVEQDAERIRVRTTSGRTLSGQWCFDSRPRPVADRRQVHYLDQHFRGWFIRSAAPVFDPQQATFMDFRTGQRGETRFFYVLPFSPTEALVEIAIFSNNHLSRSAYDELLTDYLRNCLPETLPYSVIETEGGNIPMTDYPFARHDGRIIYLGMAGGDTRPSTGYTFLNIQRRLARLTGRLAAGEDPRLAEGRWEERFGLYDATLLRVLQEGYYPADRLFYRLFRRNPPARLLAFLNGESRFAQELAVMQSVPLLPFVRAMAGVLKKRWQRRGQ